MPDRTLLLVRHAKADYPEGVQDRDRPLSERGQRDASAIAATLTGRAWPELVLCSPAVRARQTWEAMEAAVEDPTTVRYEPSLYLAAPRTILGLIRGVAPDVQRLAVVGHNPGLHELALELAGHGDKRALAQLRAKLPTAGVAEIRLAASWDDLQPGVGTLRELHVPRA